MNMRGLQLCPPLCKLKELRGPSVSPKAMVGARALVRTEKGSLVPRRRPRCYNRRREPRMDLDIFMKSNYSRFPAALEYYVLYVVLNSVQVVKQIGFVVMRTLQ